MGLKRIVLSLLLTLTYTVAMPPGETLDQKFNRLKNELSVKDTLVQHPELNVDLVLGMDEDKVPKVEPFPDDFTEPSEPLIVDKIDPSLLPSRPKKAERTFTEKLFFSATSTMDTILSNMPKSLFGFLGDPEEAAYITPAFDPAKQSPTRGEVYPAVEKKKPVPIPTPDQTHRSDQVPESKVNATKSETAGSTQLPVADSKPVGWQNTSTPDSVNKQPLGNPLPQIQTVENQSGLEWQNTTTPASVTKQPIAQTGEKQSGLGWQNTTTPASVTKQPIVQTGENKSGLGWQNTTTPASVTKQPIVQTGKNQSGLGWQSITTPASVTKQPIVQTGENQLPEGTNQSLVKLVPSLKELVNSTGNGSNVTFKIL